MKGEIVKTIDLHLGGSGRSGPAHKCELQGCQNNTREGKPFCPDHVDTHPYVQEILRTLEEREASRDRIKRRGARAVDPMSLDSMEVLLHLQTQGKRTLERLVRELQIEMKVLTSIVEVLAKKKFVKTGRTRRGTTTVCLLRMPE